MKIVDQMGRELHLKNEPKQVISLVPSITEYLIDIGVEVVGRTKFCIHPSDKVSKIKVIGGTKNFRFDDIDKLNPDFIVGNKEENFEVGINHLSEKHPVWMSDISNLEDAFEMMIELGRILDKSDEAVSQVQKVSDNLSQYNNSKKGKAVYLIWANPWMAAGSDTFINHMLDFLGYKNAIEGARYPVVNEHDLQQLDPAFILLSSEPFPFKSKHRDALQALLPKAKIIDVDGEAYSWYGSRLSKLTY